MIMFMNLLSYELYCILIWRVCNATLLLSWSAESFYMLRSFPLSIYFKYINKSSAELVICGDVSTTSVKITVQYSLSWEVTNSQPVKKLKYFTDSLSIQYCVHSSPAHLPVLNQISLDYAFKSYLFQIHRNITPPSNPRSSEWSLAIRFRHLMLHVYSFSPKHATASAPSTTTILYLNWGEMLVSRIFKFLTIFFLSQKLVHNVHR
jgi:hypothetical protein